MKVNGFFSRGWVEMKVNGFQGVAADQRKAV